MSEISDGDLVARCLAGEKNAYAELVGRYERPLMAQLRGRLRDAREVEEIAQDIFARAYFALGRLKNREAFFPWLSGFARRVILEHFRSRRSDRKRVELGEEDQAASSPEEADHDLLERAIDRLPDRYREVILLRYYAGLSCAQVGERLNLELGTVTKSLSRAYALLRESMGATTERANRREVKP